MATQSLTIAAFDNGAVTVVLEYNDATNRGTALVATNNSDQTLFVQFERSGGGNGAAATVPPRTTRRVNLPNGLQLGTDAETGAVSITGTGHNVMLRCQLG
jgi:hypothetical protein